MEPSERVRRRLAAIWSADVAGYSRLMGADDVGTFTEMRTRRELLRAQVAAGGGRVVDAVGDNLLAEFASAVDAVQCALSAQDALAARDAALPESRRLPFRIGIHLGEVIVEGDAIAGDGVNVSARLCALAEPGGICISAAIAEQLRGKLEPELEDRGEQRLKNIASPVRVYLVRSGGPVAGRPFPPQAPRRESRPAVAVLPFENLGGDPEQEYLSDGIAEDLLTRMARWDLPVIARQSSFAYRGRRLDVRTIGRELGARYVVEGSLRRAGDRIRLAVQLIDAESGEHVFAQNFDRELGDVLALQDEITRAVAGSLGVSISRREEQRALALEPENVGAWDAYLRAVWHHLRSTPTDWREGRRLARLAIERDPRFARAHAILAMIGYSGIENDWADDAERSLAEVLESARRAIELDASDFVGHLALGFGRFRAGDTAGAQLAFERAVELQPELPSALGNFGWFLVASGQFDAAVPVLERAIDFEQRYSGERGPSHPLWYAHLSAAHYGAGRDAEALRAAERGLQIGQHPLLHGLRAVILVQLGRVDDARRHVLQLPGIGLTTVERVFRSVDRSLVARVLAALRIAGMPD
jgi:adenylate cyclase